MLRAERVALFFINFIVLSKNCNSNLFKAKNASKRHSRDAIALYSEQSLFRRFSPYKFRLQGFTQKIKRRDVIVASFYSVFEIFFIIYFLIF